MPKDIRETAASVFQGVILPADGMVAAHSPVTDFGTSAWQLSE
jgi:hypothetical protein